MIQYLYDETRSLKEALEAGRININQFRAFLVYTENFFEECCDDLREAFEWRARELRKEAAVPMSTVEAEHAEAPCECPHDHAKPMSRAEVEAEMAGAEVACECPHDHAKPCVHECSICLKALTIHDKESICWMCEEELVTVEEEWPEDAAQAKEYSIFRDGAYHALVLRIRANNCREAAYDTDDAQETRSCLREAKRLDEVASQVLYESAKRMFKPWWFSSWNYWMMPGSTHKVPEWAAPKAQPLPEPYYKHSLWPSPRPKLFAKACAPHLKSMKHQEALVFLANRANITVDELREMSPSNYAEKYMTSVPDCWRAMIGRRPWWYNGPFP